MTRSTVAIPQSVTMIVQPVDEAIVVACDACDVCDHPISQHDPIGKRYCRATQANAISRNCICASAV